MRTPARILALSLLTFGLVLSGCDSSEGEDDSLVGSYTAVEAEGESLPTEVNRGESECSGGRDRIYVVDSGLLNLRENMTFSFSITQESFCEGSDHVEAETATASGDYGVSGGDVTFVMSERSDNLENFDLEGEVQSNGDIEVILIAEEQVQIMFSK